MKFKVGDKVRVKTDLITKKNYNGYEFKETMKWTKGREFTVDICAVNGYILCSPHYIFTDDMLELVEQPTKDPSQFTKADLKTKMVVKLRDTHKAIVVNDIILFEDDTWDILSDYEEDLTFKRDDKFDIISVYKIERPSGFSFIMQDTNLKLIWERPQLKPITKAELAKMGYKLEDK